MNLVCFYFLFFTVFGEVVCMYNDPGKGKEVEINGKKCSLEEHLLELSFNKDHLKYVELILFEENKDGNIYRVISYNGNMSYLTPKTWEYIKQEKYLFMPYYRLNDINNGYHGKEVKAFILGTTDTEHTKKFINAYWMKNKADNSNSVGKYINPYL